MVGAGAVGQVFGHHLARGGAIVDFFVKPKYEAETRAGFRMQALHHPGSEPVLFRPHAVWTSPEQVAAQKFELVFLCMSSTGLKRGAWLKELAPAIESATVIALQPGLEDRAFIAAAIPESRTVWAMFPLVSFIEPPVTKYYLPPLTKIPLSGPGAELPAKIFDRGGLPAKVVGDIQRSLGFSSAMINLHMAALECAGWSLAALRGDRELLKLLYGALPEAFSIVAARLKTKVPWVFGLLRPWATQLSTWIAPKIAPFPLEDYFQLHFSKVGDQTIAQLHAFARAGEEFQLPVKNIELLSDFLQRARSPRG